MQYNLDYLHVHYPLVKTFLNDADKYILDVSYDRVGVKIEIQVVLLKGHFISDDLRKRLAESLPEFNLDIKDVYLTKEQFNENIGEWAPKYYDWLDNVLYSKAEVL